MKGHYRRDVEKLALALGFTVEHTAKNHFLFRHPNGATVYASSSPNNAGRGLANVRADLRRAARTGVVRQRNSGR